MEPMTMKVNDVEYVRKDSVQTKDYSDSTIRILVLQRGWVAVGYYFKDGETVQLEKASVVRIWGTSKGLGELRDGPTSKTVLDPIGIIQVHELAVVMSVKVDSTVWVDALK